MVQSEQKCKGNLSENEMEKETKGKEQTSLTKLISNLGKN